VVEAIVTLPSTTVGMGELLSHQHATRHALYGILVAVSLSTRLPFRGDKYESDSNIIQLKIKAEVDPLLAEWLK